MPRFSRSGRSRKRPVRRWTRRGLLALIALLVLWFFEGQLPVGGSDEGARDEQPDAVAEARPEVAPIAPPVLALRPELLPEDPAAGTEAPDAAAPDALAGLDARFEWLLAEGRLHHARALAERCVAEGRHAEERELGRRTLARLDLQGEALEEDLRRALLNGDVPLAEERFAALRDSWRERAERFLAALPPVPEAAASAEVALLPLLPLALEPGRSLTKVRGDSGILRERGERAWRYRRVPLADCGPLLLHESIGASHAAPEEQERARVALARLYARADRPIAAAVVQQGRPLPPAGPR